MQAEIAKLRAETAKIIRETGVVPFMAGATVTLALTGLVGVLLKWLGI